MTSIPNILETKNNLKMLPKGFNKKKTPISYNVVTEPHLLEIQNLGRKQCLSKDSWPQIDKINAWMISAETATFMKWGGLGMIATELPDVFNAQINDGNSMTVVTPLYLGDTGKKKAFLEQNIYYGAEHKNITITKELTIDVPFITDKNTPSKNIVTVYTGKFGNTSYIFLDSPRFFSITPHKNNPSAQDGCYVLNENNINEVERFAFFSKSVYELVKSLNLNPTPNIPLPNILVANDWHSGALSGLMKYFPIIQSGLGRISEDFAEKLKNIPIIHIAHHLGYQGWDYENTAKILNSLYEDTTSIIYRNAKAIKNSNPRTTNTLIVHDCYNQASCDFHLADRVVTVSKNYMEEVSKELGFGFDFRDILKIRKDHRNFYGIVNGYEKQLISPNINKIDSINSYFGDTNFQVFDKKSIPNKLNNKKEFIKLISKIATDKAYKDKKIPLIDIYKFEDVSDALQTADKTPVICATSRLVEQKGYDIAAQAILNLAETNKLRKEYPIFILGGAGDINYFEILKKLKDKVQKINPEIAKRIFVFRGYRDEFAYAIQLAADFYMMPCRFEPCGLTQMEAMAKGTLPIAMSTGGLVDTIDDGVDGFRTEVFFADNRRVYGNNITARRIKNNENAYTETLYKSLETFYNEPQKIIDMKKAALKKDFSWGTPDGSLYKYYRLFKTGHI